MSTGTLPSDQAGTATNPSKTPLAEADAPREKVFPELKAKLSRITAKDADKLFAHNKSNRPFMNNLFNRYLDQFLDGRWRSMLPIVVYIDWFGDMHNGQHSLKALMAAEAYRLKDAENKKLMVETHPEPFSIEAVIITGIDPDDANLIDVGKGRSHGDVVFRMDLFENPDYSEGQLKTIGAWLATAAKIVCFRTRYAEKVRSGRKFEHAEMVEILDEHPLLQVSVEKVFKQDIDSDHALKGLINPAYMAAAHYLACFSEMSKNGTPKRTEKADEFLDGIANGLHTAEAGAPIHELRQWLTAQSKGVDKGNAALERRYDSLVVAWNAFIGGEQIARAAFKVKEGETPLMGGVDTMVAVNEDTVAGMVKSSIQHAEEIEKERLKLEKEATKTKAKEEKDAAAQKLKDEKEAAKEKADADKELAKAQKEAAAKPFKTVVPGKKVAVKTVVSAKGATVIKKVAVVKKVVKAAVPTA